jgi:hypothetical protein
MYSWVGSFSSLRIVFEQQRLKLVAAISVVDLCKSVILLQSMLLWSAVEFTFVHAIGEIIGLLNKYSVDIADFKWPSLTSAYIAVQVNSNMEDNQPNTAALLLDLSVALELSGKARRSGRSLYLRLSWRGTRGGDW